MQTNLTAPPKWGIFAPLFSLVIYLVGHGLLTTLLTVRLNLNDTPSILIGMVSTAYFGGLVAGTFINSRIIIRIGHIRAYAAYASILASIAILFGLIDTPEIWIILRFLSGFATGGLLVVIESWMLVSSRPEIRGRVVALYMILFYGALAAGQLLLKVFPPETLEPLTLVAMAASLSVVPLALTRVDMPQLKSHKNLRLLALIRKTPAGIVSGFSAGMLLGVVYGLLPLYFTEAGYNLSETANMMVVVIVGGVIWQYPIGRISDRLDRRIVLASLFLVTAALSVAYVLLSAASNIWLSAALLFVAGGMFFSIYPISLSHACDELAHEEIMGANQGLLLCYSVGAMMGPLIAPLFMAMLSSVGIFWYFSLLATLSAVFLSWRLTKRAAVPVEQHEAFAINSPTTPVSAELDPRSETIEPAEGFDRVAEGSANFADGSANFADCSANFADCSANFADGSAVPADGSGTIAESSDIRADGSDSQTDSENLREGFNKLAGDSDGPEQKPLASADLEITTANDWQKAEK